MYHVGRRICKLARLGDSQSVSGASAVEHAAEVFVDRRRSIGEGFVGGAGAIRISALAAFSSLPVFFKTEWAMQSGIATAGAGRGYPVVVFALVVALCADRHRATA
jgi:hypothetical protein